MRSIFLIVTCMAFATATTRIKMIEIAVNVRLHCQNPYGKWAHVFLMEDDFADNAIDEDDTLDFHGYHFDSDKKLRLYGEDFEWTGIEPYLHVSHSCVKKLGAWDSIRVDLMSGMYRSRIFDVDIDLDTGNVTVTSQRMH